MANKQFVQPLDSLTFRELATKAGFGTEFDIDTQQLAEFYGVHEITIKRWLKLRVCTPATMKLLQLHILQIEQQYWMQHFDKYKKYEFIERQLERLDLNKLYASIRYPIIKKLFLRKLINSLEWLYLKAS